MLRIGELASATGETVKTLRFWEQQGLLEAYRSETGYRYFGDRMVERPRFIRRAQALGFTHVEIREILELREKGRQPCKEVREQLRAHLDAIRIRLGELQRMESELEARLRWADEADEEPLCQKDCVYLTSDPESVSN